MKKKKYYLFDLIGITGFSSAMYGTYMMHGLAVALIIGGSLAVLLSIIKQWRQG